jgi:uncharacterized protein with PIN domain
MHLINRLLSLIRPMSIPTTNAKRRKRTPLIEGRSMRCPRCKKLHDILAYVPLQQIEEFSAETNPIYKCPSCRWMFSPAPHFLEDFTLSGYHNP